MKSRHTILAINPGSTSTKISLFEDDKEVMKKTIDHNDQTIASFPRVWDQYEYRKTEILQFIQESGFQLNDIDCVVGRGGLFKPTISGTYEINGKMLNDARGCYLGEHASNLGCVLAYGIGWDLSIPSFVVDPPCVDEMEDIARFSGHAGIPRKSIHHALNIKAVARRTAGDLKKPLESLNLIIAHIGGGISIAALHRGRMVDSTNALNEGPFSAERTGNLPVLDFYDYTVSNDLSPDEVHKQVVGRGGVFSYLGTKSIEEVEQRIEKGDDQAEQVLKAMGYQAAKFICSMVAVLKGEVDAVIITGGAAHSTCLVEKIQERVEFLGKFIVHPGEDEMEALALGALRVLKGEEKALSYPVRIGEEA
jgi:butyrate kinase